MVFFDKIRTNSSIFIFRQRIQKIDPTSVKTDDNSKGSKLDDFGLIGQLV